MGVITVTLDEVDTIDLPASDDLADWFQWQIIVQARTGTGAYGEQYADPIGLWAWVKDSDTVVRDSTGAQVVASTTVLVPKNSPTNLGPGTLVLLPNEFGARQTVAIAVSRNLGDDLPEHVKLACQ